MFTVNLKVPRHKIIHTGSSKWTFVVIHPQVGKFEEEKIYKKRQCIIHCGQRLARLGELEL